MTADRRNGGTARTGAGSRDGRRRFERAFRRSAVPPLRRRERLAELRHRAETIGRHRRQRLPDGLVHAFGYARPHPLHARRGLGESLRQDRLGRGARVRRLARQHLVEHRGQRVHVGARVERRGRRRPAPGSCRPACRSPGRSRSAGGHRPPSARAMPKSATSECPSRGEQDVLRLDVAVDHLVPVGVAAAHRPPRARSAARPRPGAAAPAGAGRAVISPSTKGMVNQSGAYCPPGGCPPSRSTVRMCGCCRRAASRISRWNRSGPRVGGELGMEHLERDGAVMAEVAREPDRGHAPAPELPLERVAIAQPFLDLRPSRPCRPIEEGCVTWPLQYPGGCTKPEARRGRVPRRRIRLLGRCAPSG